MARQKAFVETIEPSGALEYASLLYAADMAAGFEAFMGRIAGLGFGWGFFWAFGCAFCLCVLTAYPLGLVYDPNMIWKTETAAEPAGNLL